jgi:hypothetical protein
MTETIKVDSNCNFFDSNNASFDSKILVFAVQVTISAGVVSSLGKKTFGCKKNPKIDTAGNSTRRKMELIEFIRGHTLYNYIAIYNFYYSTMTALLLSPTPPLLNTVLRG